MVFTVKSLDNGIEASRKNIKVFEEAIDKEMKTIKEYREMIDKMQQQEDLRKEIASHVEIERE